VTHVGFRAHVKIASRIVCFAGSRRKKTINHPFDCFRRTLHARSLSTAFFGTSSSLSSTGEQVAGDENVEELATYAYTVSLNRRLKRWMSLAILDPRVGHAMDVLSPFSSVLCHCGWLFHGESCPRLDVVHPGRAWSSSPACTWHCSLHYLFLQRTPLFPYGVTSSMLAFLLWRCLTVSCLLQLC